MNSPNKDHVVTRCGWYIIEAFVEERQDSQVTQGWNKKQESQLILFGLFSCTRDLQHVLAFLELNSLLSKPICCLCVCCFNTTKDCVYHDFIYVLVCRILFLWLDLRLGWFFYCFSVFMLYLFLFGCFPSKGFETGLIFLMFYSVYVIFMCVWMFPLDRNKDSLDYFDIYYDLIRSAVNL